ncbi:MAG: tRNA (adenosine(37)-N6)-threonylcarbamoyltransferase complex transferase subunit TsaD [Candidatus Sungbacteria bacterium]|nr:tRNA (adenosine(37)-N6)-threonylcarbamoyltransferase complex transferase subunit TsaD [Candidatus Sungbacteria bacterium]
MRILAIETSCDETSIAVVEFGNGRGYSRRKFKTRIRVEKIPGVRVLSHIVLSQIPLHKKFGGVVPNLARREHQHNLAPILLKSIREAKLLELRTKNLELRNWKQKLNLLLEREPELLEQFIKKVLPLKPPLVDAIAVTYGPGLAPALWVGVNFAKALAYLWDKPLIPVNHMAGHAHSALLKQSRIGISNFQFPISKRTPLQTINYKLQTIKFPALALLVSGGHTELVLMRGHGKFKIIGETLDDAAGEAFDKVARLLGLSYPGGPAISEEAEKNFQFPISNFQTNSKLKILNFKTAIKLPRPMINSKDYNFSFSGLKTAVLYLTRNLGLERTKSLRPFIAKEFQDAVVEVLVKKTIRAAKEYRVKTILLGGGVAANKLLRTKLEKSVSEEIPNSQFLIPNSSLCGDNALMIAVAAYFTGKKIAWRKLQADANLRFSS